VFKHFITLGFCNVKIAGNEVTSCSLVESKRPNVSSAMGLTSLKTIVSLAGVAKLTLRQILLTLKQKKANHVLISLNALTVEIIIKLIQTYVPFGDIGSTKIGTRKNTLRSMKTGPNQLVQL